MGKQPLTPHTLAMGYTGRSPVAFKFAILGQGAKKNEESLSWLHKGLVRRMKDPSLYLGRSARCPTKLSCHRVVVTFYDKEINTSSHTDHKEMRYASDYGILGEVEGQPESEASWEPADTLWHSKSRLSVLGGRHNDYVFGLGGGKCHKMHK
ncbi:hypothetical protein CK203_055528 [Vitis vinifera]|uniref:Uncharacterized protein n=1 Tax=Vitis vinifera TaxID=29760 RepID=A0A438GXK4_VITVI|nr:hypothetical protein CK203_055528 [Vitis vinifera]